MPRVESLHMPERWFAPDPRPGDAPRVAVIGSGVAGLAAAHRLAPRCHVTLFEADARPGGHAHTVDVTLDGVTAPVDTGFLVFNHRTYPGLVRLFDELRVPTAASDMSFSVSIGPHGFEWCGTDLGALFARPANALSPRFWSMLADILRFNRQASALALAGDAPQAEAALSLDRWLERHRYGRPFRDLYLLPMAAAIWSCPTKAMLAFPVGTFARFCHNHGLLQIADRPQWFTVDGGSRRYVERIVAGLDDVRLSTPVRAVLRGGSPAGEPRMHGAAAGGCVAIVTDRGTESFDHVVLACHSDQSLRLLADASDAERAVLSAVAYQPNRAWLHTDAALMPRRRRAWAAWNYLSDGAPDAPRVSVSYWLNRLQPLPFDTPLMVTLNPIAAPREDRTIAVLEYSHPVFDSAAIEAQRRLPSIQGRHGTWFAGAWTGYGFHEDGLRSGLDVAARLAALEAGRAVRRPAAATLRAAA